MYWQLLPLNEVLSCISVGLTSPRLVQVSSLGKCSSVGCIIETHSNTIQYNIHIIKPTRSTNFSNLFVECDSTWFGQFLCPSSGV